ncbi:MAG TPA: hypothetical protein VGO19_02755 [Actinomycetes bacterium]|jgi:hypothetical protein
MSITEGHFRLYTHVEPALKAGDYRFVTDQTLAATDKDGPVTSAELPVQELQTHVRVTSPRYLLPPDQVLSTYPPAGTEGAYGARLPQVVIKRRTLPWERFVDGGDDATPWLALVVFAEGEADVLTNVDVAQCITSGVQLPGPVDVPKASCLEIRSSMVAKILPTRKDVPLLAHAREVNIDDTEMMLGDDDGFLAVVVANRLPVAGRDAQGAEAPVKYHAALISLEGPGQFAQLLEKSPAATNLTDHLVLQSAQTAYYSAAEYDHYAMSSSYSNPVLNPAVSGGIVGPHAAAAAEVTAYRTGVAQDRVTTAYSGSGGWQKTNVGAELGAVQAETGIQYVGTNIVLALDQKVRFPCLLHWTFTSTGDVTFELLMRNADNGLLGTTGQDPQPPTGRPPLEVVETGHVGLDQRTRRGDLVRAWYRGPLLPHPADLTSPRLPLAHTGDQLRAVIPDGREDLSLAAAFEIGRLLALSQPSMVASLLRWRQGGYQAARLGALWDGILEDFDLGGIGYQPGRLLGTALGRGLVRSISANPTDTVGPPRELLTAGTPMALPADAKNAMSLVTRGFGLDLAADVPLTQMVGSLQATQVPRVPLGQLSTTLGTQVLQGQFATLRDASLVQLAAGALSTQIMTHPGAALDEGPDALDRALAGERDDRDDRDDGQGGSSS